MEQNAVVVEAPGIEFPIVSDLSLETIDAFGFRHETKAMSDNVAIPRSATYIIGADGTVQWRGLTENWRVRPRPDDILRALATTGR